MISEVMAATLEQAGANVLSAAIGVLGSRLATGVTGPRGREAEDLPIARWFETYKLTKRFPELPGLSDELASRLAGLPGGDAVQAALQELLAVRLTDADDVEAGRARDVLCLTSDPRQTRPARANHAGALPELLGWEDRAYGAYRPGERDSRHPWTVRVSP